MNINVTHTGSIVLVQIANGESKVTLTENEFAEVYSDKTKEKIRNKKREMLTNRKKELELELAKVEKELR